MKYSTVVLIGFSLLLGLAANAQRYDPYYRGGDRGYGDRYGYESRGSLIGQVVSDLDRIGSNAWVDHHERDHFYEASRKLQEFEARWTQGNFDKGKLDKAIENIQHLANADQLRGRDRDILNRDLTALRQFRSTRGGYRDYRDDRYDRR